MIRMLLIIAAITSLPLLSPAAEVAKPNIVLIFVDDLGYGDLGCYGGKDIPTPNIDRLAARGVRFTDGYVTAPVCGPSRVGLLTGAYQQRFGCYWNEDLWLKYGLRLPDGHKLLPQALKAGGYVTGLIGKWNITPEAKPYVDEAHDVMYWKGAYFPDAEGDYLGVDGPDFRVEQHGWGPERPDDEYLTDRLTRRAIDFIDRHAGRPFFLYLAYNAPHTPLQAKHEYDQRFSHLKDEPNRLYAGMVASLDENIGRVLDKLAETGLEQNTLVAFVSDNGPARGADYLSGWRKEWPEETLLGSAGPLAGHKAQLQEGGIREPFILCWPGHLEAGRVYSRPVSTLDLYPTSLRCRGHGNPQRHRTGRRKPASLPQGRSQRRSSQGTVLEDAQRRCGPPGRHEARHRALGQAAFVRPVKRPRGNARSFRREPRHRESTSSGLDEVGRAVPASGQWT